MKKKKKKKGNRKHDGIVLPANGKLNTIEFVSVDNVLREYNEIKGETTNHKEKITIKM